MLDPDELLSFLESPLVRNDSVASLEDAEAEEYIVRAYCQFSKRIVNIRYPDVKQGWLFRADLSSTASLCWQIGEAVVLVSRHTNCDSAVIPGFICRQCRNRWRKQCLQKCDTFFLLPMHDSAHDLLSQLVLNVIDADLTTEQIALYTSAIPRTSIPLTQRSTSPSTNVKAFQIERKMRARLINDGKLTRSQAPPDAVDMLIDVAYGFLEEEKKLPSFSVSPPAVALKLPSFSESPQAVVPTPAKSANTVVRAATLATPGDRQTVAMALDNILLYASSHADLFGMMLWDAAVFEQLTKGYNFYTPIQMLSASNALAALARPMRCEPRTTELILLPQLYSLMQSIRKTIDADKACEVGVAVYRAPTVEAYYAMYSGTAEGRVVLSPCVHRHVRDPAHVRPIVVLFHSSSLLSVAADRLVPVGVLELDSS